MSYTEARDMDNRRLARQGAPYRYDIAGHQRCAVCGEYWNANEAPSNWQMCKHNTALLRELGEE